MKSTEKNKPKIAITGFLPFNGRDVNPSQLIVERIVAPDGYELVKKILPVEYKRSSIELLEFLNKEKPDILLSIGQAGNVPHISVERVAINLDNTKTSDGNNLFPDQSGAMPVDETIREDGDNAYFATIPVWDIVKAINDKNIPARASYSAGTFICNHVMYEGLYYAEKQKCLSGFIHVPFIPEQLIGDTTSGRYAMNLEDMTEAIQTAIEFLFYTNIH